MKIFISWSGELSKNIANIFYHWIPKVIQVAKPYYSGESIIKGSRSITSISKELEATKIGLIIMTEDNQNNAWIIYESGALAKHVDESKVVPILINLTQEDIKAPLNQFQAARLNKKEIRQVIEMINSETNAPLNKELLKTTFDKWYPDLKKAIKKQIAKKSKQSVTGNN